MFLIRICLAGLAGWPRTPPPSGDRDFRSKRSDRGKATVKYRRHRRANQFGRGSPARAASHQESRWRSPREFRVVDTVSLKHIGFGRWSVEPPITIRSGGDPGDLHAFPAVCQKGARRRRSKATVKRAPAFRSPMLSSAQSERGGVR